jgi:pilus assembly protein Flp/PilA
MSKLILSAKRFWNDDEAATAVEYGIIVAMVAVGIGAALIGVRQEIIKVLDDVKNALTSMGTS